MENFGNEQSTVNYEHTQQRIHLSGMWVDNYWVRALFVLCVVRVTSLAIKAADEMNI